MINKIFDRSKYIFTVALLVLLSFHLHAALLSEPLHSIPNTALHTLEQWPSGIFRIEVLIGGNSGSNAYEKRPHFSFKIIEVLRPSRDTLGDLNIPIEATWVRSCIESNCQDSEKFLSPTPGTRALISIWGGGAPLLVSDHFWADNPENYQVAKRLIVFRPLTDYLLEYTFFLALILPFIALLIGYFNLHLAAGISLIRADSKVKCNTYKPLRYVDALNTPKLHPTAS